MFERYRLFFIAFAGLALAGASPPANESGQGNPRASNAQIERALEEIAAATQQSNEPSVHDEPCPSGQDNRNSDLCAQWKAADSAQSAANAAWWIGALGVIIGLATLGAAVAAAMFARDAAIHTQTGALEAKRSAEAAEDSLATSIAAFDAQIRPYVAITLDEGHSPEPFSRESLLRFVIKNFGQIPATNVRLSMGEATRAEPFGSYIVPLGDKGGDYGLLPPGDSRQEKIHTRDLTPTELGELAEGKVKMLLRLRIDYIWDGGADFHDITTFLDDPSTNTWCILDGRRRNKKSPTNDDSRHHQG